MSSTLRPTKNKKNYKKIIRIIKEIRRIIEKYKKRNIKKIITTKKTI